MKTKLTTKQLEKINDIVYNEINKESLKDLYNHYKDYFNKPISYKKFKQIFIDYIINGFDKDNSLKVFDDYENMEYEKFDKLEQFKTELKQKSTNELIIFNDENTEFNNFEYYDYDFILEDLKLRFNQTEKYFFTDNGYNNDLYLKVKGLDSVLSELEYYDNFKEFLEQLDTIIYQNGFTLENLFLKFITEYHYKDFKFNDKLDFNKLITDIKTDIKTELNTRKIKYQKDNIKMNKEIREINKENYEINKKTIIKNALESYKTQLEGYKTRNKTESNLIKEYLKN